MKKKYLLSALLGGAMLTACSVDDDLNLSKGAQEDNPLAPVFTVSFEGNENPLTRADYVGSHVKFQEGDKMSLYHGVTETNLFEFEGWQNAIYEAQADLDGDGASVLSFKTRAMVVPGKSILIYPADEDFNNGLADDHTGAAAPMLTIDVDQDETTKTKMPYMSEVLTIDNYTGTTDKWLDKPGYNKEYEVVMKRVASTLLLTLNRIEPTKAWPEGVEEIALKKVELKSTNDEVAPFTKSIAIKALTDKASVARSVKTNSSGEVTEATYYSWQNQSDVNQETTVSVAAITTTDINENNVAQFTLLPTSSNFNVTGEDEKRIIADGEGAVVVYTNYGSVTLTDPSDEEVAADEEAGLIWDKLSEAENYPTTISKGLDSLLYNVRLWGPAAEGTIFYKDEDNFENMGSGMRRQVEVDLNKINMNGLHIENEAHLIAVSKVLPVIGLKENSTFYLDGTGSNKEFRIKTKEGRQAYNDIINYSQKISSSVTYTVGLERCQANNNEKCNVVVFENTGDEAEALKVPSSLKFNKIGEGENNATTEGTEVQLAVTGTTNKWLLDGERTFVGVDSVVVNSGATLQLKGDVANKNTAYKNSQTKTGDNLPYLKTTELVNNGKIVTETGDDVVLRLNTCNHGEITVNGRLRMSGLDVVGISANENLTLVNEVTGKNYTESTTKCGVIKLNARLATVDNTNARIYNYGYIEVTGDDGSVLLYANGTQNADFNKAFTNKTWGKDVEHSGDNIFGVLRVKSTSNPLTNIQDPKAQGFVKYKGNITSNALINYVEIASEANTTIGSMSIPYVEYLAGSKNYVVEVQGKGGSGSDKDVTTVKSGLIVPNGVTVSIPADKTLIVGNIYLKGEVYRAGTFTINATGTGVTKFVTYVGGAADDQYKVSSDGGAQ